MITKYGMSREAMHYGSIVESSLPLITDAEVYEPLEADLERAQVTFRERMGRFMSKRSRNKLHYKIGKEKKFYIDELVMYKVYKPDSMLHPTYTGPARIIDLNIKGATLRDPKTGATFSVSFENLRKINFEELLSLLPQNFDAEIADALGTYRYRRAIAEPEREPETVLLTPDSELHAEPDLEPDPEPVPEATKSLVNPDHPDDTMIRRTRSGKIYNVKAKRIPPKIRESVRCATMRMVTIPRLSPGNDLSPRGTCLKRRYKNDDFFYQEMRQLWDPGKLGSDFSEKSLSKIALHQERTDTSTFSSRDNCTQNFVLKADNSHRKVRFGDITVYFV
jgi:hypothetical protein